MCFRLLGTNVCSPLTRSQEGWLNFPLQRTGQEVNLCVLNLGTIKKNSWEKKLGMMFGFPPASREKLKALSRDLQLRGSASDPVTHKNMSVSLQRAAVLVTAATCIVPPPHLHLLLHNRHIKGFKHRVFKGLRKRKPFGHCFNPTKERHAEP